MFIIVSIPGDNKPTYCLGPFASKDEASSWLENKGFKITTLYDSWQNNSYYERKGQGWLSGDGGDSVWIRELRNPTEYQDPREKEKPYTRYPTPG